MKIKKIMALIMASAMMLSMAACGGAPATSDVPGKSGDTTTDAATPSDGQKTIDGNVLDKEQYFNGYLAADPTTLSSVKGSDTDGGTILVNTLEPLTRMEEENGVNIVKPAGAEKWESNADGTVWTFHLRDNKWSDGQPVKAEDYAYGISQVLDPTTGSPNSYLINCVKNGVKVNAGELAVDQLGVKALDDKTLEITLESPTPYFLSLTYGRATFPMRKDFVEKYGETYGAEIDTFIGNGPFKISSWTHNSEIVLVKNEEYWDKDTVNLETVNYKILNDETAIFNSFDNGSLDQTGSGSPEWIERFKAKPDVTYTYTVSPSVRFHFFNTKDPLFANANVRKAFTVAINREEVANAIYHDTMVPSYSWVPQGVSTGELGEFRKQAEEPLKLLQTEVTDPKALLIKGMEELGLGSDPSTLKVKFTLGDTSQWIRNYGEYYQQVFNKLLGVNVEIECNEWGTFQSKTESGDYQMGYMVWGIDFNDPISMLSTMVSTAGSIPTGWNNPEYDKLIAQASIEMDEAKRVEFYKQAETILLHDDAVLCPVVNETINRFRYNYIKKAPDLHFTSTGLKYAYCSGR